MCSLTFNQSATMVFTAGPLLRLCRRPCHCPTERRRVFRASAAGLLMLLYAAGLWPGLRSDLVPGPLTGSVPPAFVPGLYLWPGLRSDLCTSLYLWLGLCRRPLYWALCLLLPGLRSRKALCMHRAKHSLPPVAQRQILFSALIFPLALKKTTQKHIARSRGK